MKLNQSIQKWLLQQDLIIVVNVISSSSLLGVLDENVIFGEGTKNAVNFLLMQFGYKPNGIAGEKFINALYKAIL